MAVTPIMETTDVRVAIDWQAGHAERADAPITARIVRAELAILGTQTELARRIANWPGLSLEDAMPLRVAGALHWLHLSGADSALAGVYSGEVTDQASVDEIVAGLAIKWDSELVPWLNHPPQTNEAGRSSSIMAGLLWLSQRLAPRFEMLEIGASAGVNTMMERYRYDLGGTVVGPEDSPMLLKPDWRGPPPPAADVEITSIRGCDMSPVDLSVPAEALRLKAYVWADAHERMARLEVAAQLAAQSAPLLEEKDAGLFVEDRLSVPQDEGVTRVLYHSVMWQYLPVSTRDAITAAMERAGEQATAERPLAWVRLETNRQTFRHELSIRYWPGGEEAVVLSEAHPHGAWIEWRGA